jgi:hypothetical protein
MAQHVAARAGRDGVLPPDPDRNLALELVRVTEAAAIAAARCMGRNDKERVDQAAVDAMRPVLRSIQIDGVIVIGEGEKDEAPMLYNGERAGGGAAPAVDVAVDPVDGTTLTAKPARRAGGHRANGPPPRRPATTSTGSSPPTISSLGRMCSSPRRA